MNRLTVGIFGLCMLLLCAACAAAAPVDAALPTQEATAVPLTPEPTRVPTEAPTRAPTEAPTPSPTATPEPEPFTLLWISDAQNYAYSSDAGLKSIVAYAIEQKDAQNIIAVLQSGDLVENNLIDAEWEKLRDDFAPLHGVLPFYCVGGNHDVGDLNSIINVFERGYAQYKKYDFCDVREPEQRYRDGECWYQFFEEQELLLVGIGWNLEESREERNAWLDSVLDAYAEYPVVILTHGYLYNNGKPNDIGIALEKEIISRHPNVRLLLCGHHRRARRQQIVYEDGRTFTAVMFNLQEEKKRPAIGYCMLVTFDPVTRAVSFTSYSPYFDDYNYYEDPANETFVLENAY